jgi:hypothetical protein
MRHLSFDIFDKDLLKVYSNELNYFPRKFQHVLCWHGLRFACRPISNCWLLVKSISLTNNYLLSVKDRGAGNVSIEWLLVGKDNVNVASSSNEVQQNEPKETSRSILVSVGLVYG